MKTSQSKINWTLVALLLVVVIIAGVVVIGLKCRGGPVVEITVAPEREIVGTIYIGGAVNNPGCYSIFTGDTLADIVATAGGLTAGAGFTDVELIIGVANEGENPQKIDINCAQAWLLEVLRRYDVGQVLYPATEGESSLYDEWVRFIGEVGIKSTIAQTGQQIDLGDGVTLEVLWPSVNGITGSGSDVDNNSVVVLLRDGDITFLLTGDAMS
jgi:hypothetical protein